MEESNTEIVVEVTQTRYNSYLVSVKYKNDAYRPAGYEYTYVSESLLYHLFKIGKPLDIKIKEATCNLIKNLNADLTRKQEWVRKNTALTEIAQEHAKKCKDKRDNNV